MDNINGNKTNWTSHGSMKITDSEIKRVISTKLQTGKRHKKKKNRADWEKSVEEAKVCVRLTVVQLKKKKKIQTLTKI
jgi:hypothetical protein